MTPYEIKIGDAPFWVVDKAPAREAYIEEHPELVLSVGLAALSAFRTQTYMDYIAIWQPTEDGGKWIRAYEQYEWFDWMAGTVYRDEGRRSQLRDTERKLGYFYTQFGWAPDYILESEPNEYEIEGYIQHVVEKDSKDTLYAGDILGEDEPE